jgi:hypothetical protein
MEICGTTHASWVRNLGEISFIVEPILTWLAVCFTSSSTERASYGPSFFGGLQHLPELTVSFLFLETIDEVFLTPIFADQTAIHQG